MNQIIRTAWIPLLAAMLAGCNPANQAFRQVQAGQPAAARCDLPSGVHESRYGLAAHHEVVTWIPISRTRTDFRALLEADRDVILAARNEASALIGLLSVSMTEKTELVLAIPDDWLRAPDLNDPVKFSRDDFRAGAWRVGDDVGDLVGPRGLDANQVTEDIPADLDALVTRIARATKEAYLERTEALHWRTSVEIARPDDANEIELSPDQRARELQIPRNIRNYLLILINAARIVPDDTGRSGQILSLEKTAGFDDPDIWQGVENESYSRECCFTDGQARIRMTLQRMSGQRLRVRVQTSIFAWPGHPHVTSMVLHGG